MKELNRITQITRVLKFTLVLSLLLPFGTVIGQEKDTGDDEFTLEEIVVTAEFREKSIQKTPLAITAVSGDTMEMRNRVRLEELGMQVPNVSLKPGNTTFGASMAAYIRGIGQTDFNPSVEPGVGIYVDDVYYSTITGNLLDLLDIERVEILRGPQGTLAGRNALGGAIKVFSQKPQGLGEGYFQVTGGSSSRLDIKAAADFSITDKLFMRISATNKNRDGYVKNIDYACYNDSPAYGQPGGVPSYATGNSCVLSEEGGQEMTAGRLSLRYIPNDDLEINFSASIVDDQSEAQPMVLLKARNMATDSDPSIPLFFDNNGNNIFDEGDVPYDDRFVTAGTYMNYSNYHDAGISTPDITQQPPEINNVDVFRPSDIEKINHLDSKDFTLSFDWQITDNVSLKSITAYREYENIFGDDSDGSPIAIQQLLQEMEHEQFTQELRLNSTLFDGYADTTIGVFYLDQETIETAQVNINYAPLDFIHGPDKVPSTSKAVYGQGTLHVNERTDVTLGARYSEDEKKYSFRRRNPDGTEIEPIAGNPFAPDSPPNQLLFATNGASTPTYSSDRFDFRIAIDYDIIEKTLVYAQIATGYRAGGNNARPYYPEQINTYDPEKLINYEAGIKSTIADQLRLNASIFFNDYTDIQLPLNACYWMPEGQKYPCASQDNIGDGEVKGLEIEGIWRPTKAFSMDFTYSYIDFEYTKIKTYEGAPLSEAKRTPYTPETTWSLGAQYRFDIGKFGDLTTRVDASFQDEMDGFSFVGLGAKIPDYTVFNSRVTWRSEDLKWQASFECTNLFDKYYYLSNFDLSDGRSIFTNAQPGRPREYALTIKRVWYFK